MLKRHSDQLWSRLDNLYTTGSTCITLAELRHWYGAQRINKTPWRDIKERWIELLEEKTGENHAELQIAMFDSGYIFFFSKESWTLTELSE